jgi:RNA polymerase sigma factor (sigma-70 family)
MPTLTEEEVGELWEEYLKTRRVETRNRLVVHYMDYTVALVKTIIPFPPVGVELDDLVAAVMLVIIQLVPKYRLDKDTDFKTFAYFRIQGAIRDELRVFGRTSRVRSFDDRDDIAVQAKDPSLIAERKELYELALKGLRLARKEDQQAVILSDLGGEKITEIGETLTRHKSVISRRRTRGLRRLRLKIARATL